jgi:hypothetical protein
LSKTYAAKTMTKKVNTFSFGLIIDLDDQSTIILILIKNVKNFPLLLSFKVILTSNIAILSIKIKILVQTLKYYAYI